MQYGILYEELFIIMIRGRNTVVNRFIVKSTEKVLDEKRGRSMSKKLIRLVVTCLICSLLCGNVLALSAAGENTQSGEVTRLEWLKALTDAFEMSVEERNYPDNYYSDIDDTSTDYYDIMLATEFGLIDVEAGDPLRPNDPATREFVAHTMNACMGYQLNDASYTFSESGSVSYPEDIQISIDRGWFALDNGSFFPEQAITNVEKDKLITIAKEAVASVKTDPDYHNQYQLAEGVVEIPENTQVALTDENQLTIYDSNISLKQGTVFVVICDGMPIARRALSVHVEDNMTIVEVEGVDVEEAFESMDVQGTIGSDLTQAQVIGDNVTLSYIVGGTEAQAYEDGVVLYSLEEVEEQDLPVSAVIATKTVEAPKYHDVESEVKRENISLKCKVTDVSVDYGLSIFHSEAHAIVTANVTFSGNIGEENFLVSSIEVPFVRIPIAIVGYLQPSAEGKIEGSLSFGLNGDLTVGAQYEDGVTRGVFDFKKKAFTFETKIEGTLGVKIALGIDVGFVKGEIFAKAGAKASVSVTIYDTDSPRECLHLTAYLYASGGGEVKFSFWGHESTHTLIKEIYNEKNSPVKVALHFEDSKPVSCCTKDVVDEDIDIGEEGEESGSESGSKDKRKYKYYTPINSQYGYSGINKGTTSSGEPYTIFDYFFIDDNKITITKYNGDFCALTIPSTIDGYTVVGIGDRVFQNNDRLLLVNIPDTVTAIGKYTFAGCSNLDNITLPKTLKSLGESAFYNCDSLESIEIPKSLETILDSNGQNGPFRGCNNLKTASFETGTTKVIARLFSDCIGLDEITIPDSVETVEKEAFLNCTNLRKVSLSHSAIQIGESAFRNCSSLREIIIPDTVTSIGNYAFANCNSLGKVTLSKALNNIGYSAFFDCDSIASIEIPKSLDTTQGFVSYSGPFRNCDNLKTVTFESGTREVAEFLFYGCTGLEEISIPDTVTVIEKGSFSHCDNLSKVMIPSSVVKIDESAFSYCTKMTKIIIPDSVTEIGAYAYEYCDKLMDVTLSNHLKSLGASSFRECDALSQIEIPKSLDTTQDFSYHSGPFKDCDNLKTVIFETGSTKVAARLFRACTGLEEIVIPDSVQIIEEDAFYGCANLNRVKFPNSLKTIGDNAFMYCGSLQIIDLPNSVNCLGNSVFARCTNLSTVRLPQISKNVTWGMFEGCTSLSEINLPDSVIEINDYAFQDSGLKSIDLPSGITTIGSHAFYNCDALYIINIPDSVTSIGTYAFSDCDVLSEVKLGNGLTKINSYSFDLCPAIQKIVFPYRVATVESNAFTSCTSLTELVVPRATTSIASDAFSYPTKMTVYGVAGTYAEEWANSVNAKFVNQENPAESVTLNETEVTLNNGKTFSLALTVVPSDFTDTVTWKSSNEAVATVSDTGVITAKGVGNATIRVTVGSKSASCKVTVVQPVTSISLNRTSLSLDAEETFALVATVYPTYANDRTVTWSSSDDSVASVDQDGNVTAHKKGTAVIAVTANDGSNISKNCTVTVLNSCFYCSSVEELESPHNYEDNCKNTWIYTLPGATKIAITFDERTCLEDEFDFLYLYDGSGAEIGKYTGTELAGKEILIIGDIVKLKMDSDDSGNEWGFKITKLEEFCEHTFSEEWTSDDDYHWHAATCGHDKEVRDKEEHIASDWIEDIETPGEEAVSRHKECTVCHRILIEEDLSPAEPVVLTQPVSAEVKDGSQATFTVSATGDGLTYQWQLCYAGDDTFRTCTFPGADTATLTVDATKARNGYSFRCVITDEHGNSVTSDAAKLTIKADVALGVALTASQTTADSGEIVTFTAVGNGGDGNYQYKFIINDTTNDKWYKLQDYSANNTIEWKATTAGTKRIMVDIKDGTGKSVGKNVSVVVNGTAAPTELKGTLTASSYEVNPGDVVTLTANGIGGSGKYNYKFIINDKTDDKWYRLQDYGTNSVIQWTATTPGTKRLMVDVMDSNGKMFGTNITITVKAAEGVLNVADEIENADDVQDVVEDIQDTDTTQNPEVDLVAEE